MRTYITIITLLIASSLFAQQRTFSLEQAIEYGLENNDEIRRGKVNIQDADQQISKIVQLDCRRSMPTSTITEI